MTAVVYRFQLMSFQQYCDHILFWHFSINFNTLFLLSIFAIVRRSNRILHDISISKSGMNPIFSKFLSRSYQFMNILCITYACMHCQCQVTYTIHPNRVGKSTHTHTKKTTCFFNLNLDHVFYETFFWRQLMI